MGGGAAALVEMDSGGVWEAHLSGDEGVYIGPSGVVSGMGVIAAGGIGLFNEGVLGPGIEVTQVAAAQRAGAAQPNPATLVSAAVDYEPHRAAGDSSDGQQFGAVWQCGGERHGFPGGVLTFDFRQGYTPKQGDTFTFLTATGGISGAFDKVEVTDLEPDFAY